MRRLLEKTNVAHRITTARPRPGYPIPNPQTDAHRFANKFASLLSANGRMVRRSPWRIETLLRCPLILVYLAAHVYTFCRCRDVIARECREECREARTTVVRERDGTKKLIAALQVQAERAACCDNHEQEVLCETLAGNLQMDLPDPSKWDSRKLGRLLSGLYAIYCVLCGYFEAPCDTVFLAYVLEAGHEAESGGHASLDVHNLRRSIGTFEANNRVLAAEIAFRHGCEAVEIRRAYLAQMRTGAHIQ